MRKLLVAVAFAMLCHISVKSQLVTYSFAGTGACPTQGNSSISFANGSASALARVGTLTCQTASNAFNSSGWSQSTAIDNSQYIEVTITANPGYKLDLTSLSFSYLKSSTGASNLQVMHNGTGTFNTASPVYTVSTTEATSVFDFTDFSSSPNATISFRIYGWGASSSTGTTRITGLQVNGAVTSSTVFVYDYTNERVGLGYATLDSKFQVGESSISTPNNAIFTRALPTNVNNNSNYNNLGVTSYLNSNFTSTPNTGLTGILNYYQGNISGTNTNQYNKVIYNQYKSTNGSGSMSYLTVNDNVFEYASAASTSHSNISLINAGTAIYGGSGNITNLAYLRATPGISSGASNYTGTITNQYGLYLGNIVGATNNYAIYSAGGKSYFADNVGIGTANPSYRLDVAANTSAVRFSGLGVANGLVSFEGAGSSGSSIWFNNRKAGITNFGGANEKMQFDVINGGSFNFGVNGQIVTSINSTGMGIGTTSPTGTLDVFYTGGTSNFGSVQGGNNAVWARSSGGSMALYAGGLTGLLSTGDISFMPNQTYGSENYNVAAIIKADGSMGIGTTTPGAFKLAVNGDIKARKLKITQTDWPDYVFAPAYKLLSLQDLESYIKKYQHLPEVPSANDVINNGVDIGDNQAILLKKIEELTLYLIKQDKELQQQRSEIQSLKKKLK